MPKQVYCKHFGDISINEYANAVIKPGGRSRIKKKNLLKEEEKLVQFTATDDIADDGMGNFYNNFDKLSVKKEAEEATSGVHQFNVFPNDFWYLLSDHIEPEEVGHFALICRQTYEITKTAKFWKNLYLRYYKPSIPLPIRLQPDCMARSRGLRACSIRSLYYTYEPFTKQLSHHPQQDFHLLAKRYVERFWYVKVQNKWFYFYKLKRKLVEGSRAAESEDLFRKNPTSLKSLRDVFWNTEEGCSLLVIQSTKFHPLPKFSEEMEHQSKFTLHAISHLLSRSCSHYRLEMKFANASKQVIGTIAYEPAVAISVYDWWTPNYYKHIGQGFQKNVEFLQDDKDPPEEIESADDSDWGFVGNNENIYGR